MIDKETYIEFINIKEPNCARLKYNKKHDQLTLTEAIKVFELAISNHTKCSGAAFWLEIERKEHILPGRDGDVLRAFWKEFSKTGLEEYIRTAGENNRRFSLMKEHIPEIK